MPNPWVLLGAVVTLVLSGFYWDHNGFMRGVETTARVATTQRIAAVEAARAEEQAKQKGVNDVLREQNEKLATVNSRLERDLDRLRNRPERPADVSEVPRAACAGANGPELARVYAEFLTRFAARAAEQDAALAACYRVIDVSTEPAAQP